PASASQAGVQGPCAAPVTVLSALHPPPVPHAPPAAKQSKLLKLKAYATLPREYAAAVARGKIDTPGVVPASSSVSKTTRALFGKALTAEQELPFLPYACMTFLRAHGK